MEKYGYMYDKLARDIQQFSPQQHLKTDENPYLMYALGVIAICVLIWILLKT